MSFLADHIDFSLALLTLHYEGEDELLWPVLIARPGRGLLDRLDDDELRGG